MAVSMWRKSIGIGLIHCLEAKDRTGTRSGHSPAYFDVEVYDDRSQNWNDAEVDILVST